MGVGAPRPRPDVSPPALRFRLQGTPGSPSGTRPGLPLKHWLPKAEPLLPRDRCHPFPCTSPPCSDFFTRAYNGRGLLWAT